MGPMKKAKCFKCDKVLKFNPGFGGHGDFSDTLRLDDARR